MEVKRKTKKKNRFHEERFLSQMGFEGRIDLCNCLSVCIFYLLICNIFGYTCEIACNK